MARDVTLNFGGIVSYTDFSYLGVRTGPVYDVLWRPKGDVKLVKVEGDGFTFFDHPSTDGGVTKFHLVLNFVTPFLASVEVGGDVKHFWKNDGTWSAVDKNVFDKELNKALAVVLSFDHPLTLDLANVDETKFHKNTSQDDKWLVYNLSPFNGHSATRVVNGPTDLWAADGSAFAYYVLFFSSSNGKLLRLHVVDDKRFAHKVRHLKDGVWKDTNTKTYFEVIGTSKSGAHTLDVTPGKNVENNHDVSFVKGKPFGVDYDLFTTSMHHNFDKVVFGGETLYDRKGKEEHCSHVAVHDGVDKKAVHVLVVTKDGSRSLFFLGKDKLESVKEEDFPKEFKVVAV